MEIRDIQRPMDRSRSGGARVLFAVLLAAAQLPQLSSNAAATGPASSAREFSMDTRDKAKVLMLRGVASADAAVPDYVSAVRDFREAASLGDAKAQMRLGELMIHGRGTSRDVDGGLDLLRQAAAAGEVNALLLLGDIYARSLAGPNRGNEAIAAYEKAAELGRALAHVKLGQIYQDGRLVTANAQKSVDAYLAAIAAGRAAALVPLGKALAEGRFPHHGSRADGIRLLENARSQGVAEAVLALSDCYLNGTGVARSRDKALTLLRTALDAGNVDAGRRLVSLYRDGRKGLLARNRKTALTYFARIKDRLQPGALQVETLLLDASAAAAGGYRGIQGQLLELRAPDRPSAVRKLRSVNPNAYVYVVQSRLGSLGYYSGSASGNLNAATMRAIRKYCGDRTSRKDCAGGPMTLRVTELLASAF